ncbi:MAG: DUF1465 family protein [Devosiaceae bacterium]|nr:DUF1465 family protein [Devosiaceae bacterium]
MSDKDNKTDATSIGPNLLSIGPSLLASKDFDRLYSQGMGLIEEVAAYLDGEGRKQSRELNREAAFVYASESMRLTTRLMQMASWLLLQRAIREGEVTSNNVIDEKEKIKFLTSTSDKSGPGWSDLPSKLLDYIEKGEHLYERVIRVDRLDNESIEEIQVEAEKSLEVAGGIAEQFSRLNAAFGKDKKSD